MSGHGVTERDLTAIVYLVGRLRQETHGANTWDELGIAAKVRELVGQNLEITLERVLRHAADPEAKTPGAIHRGFLPPAASEKTPTKRGNPKAGEDCPQHPGQWPDNCAGCRTEPVKAYNDHDLEPLPHQPAHADASLARALMAQTRANLCACGVRRETCPTHRSELQGNA